MLLDGIEMESSYSVNGNEVVFTLDSLPAQDGDKATLASESRYHRLSVLYEEGKLGEQFSGLGQSGLVESAYVFIPILVGTDDAQTPDVNEADDYTLIESWDFSSDPFSGSPAPWKRFSFKSVDVTNDPGNLITHSSGKVVITGTGAVGACSYVKCCANDACCDNVASDQIPCNPTPTPLPANDASTTPTPVPPDPDTCVHDNHECNPFCDIHNFEGGELWRKIDTGNYKNLVVEFDLEADLGGSEPHGYRPQGVDYKAGRESLAGYKAASYLPWGNCQNLIDAKSCVDCWLIEELVAVFFTDNYHNETDFGLYKADRTPRFDDGLGHSDGIDRWRVAKVIPRSVLKSQGYAWGQRVRLDFSMQDDTDIQKEGDPPETPKYFGIWIRAQLDSSEDTITIDNMTVKGQVGP
ncbi:MAG: hypothetical protein GHCLOJNM_03426 [bacterium]|nr:hypothetical protein [bacterium]